MWKDYYEPYIDENELRGFYRPLTGERFGTSLFDLHDTIKIAIAHGWKPLGTIHDDFDNWNGSYLLDANQIVTHEDAIELAAALSKALTDQSCDFFRSKVDFIRKGAFRITFKY